MSEFVVPVHEVELVKEKYPDLLSSIEEKLSQLKLPGCEIVLVVGGKSRVLSELLLRELASRESTPQWLQQTIAKRVRLGQVENKSSYARWNLRKSDIQDIPTLEVALAGKDPSKTQLVCIDDYGNALHKANGLTDRLPYAVGMQTDFICLVANEYIKPNNPQNVHVLIQKNYDLYKAMQSISYEVSTYMELRIKSMQGSLSNMEEHQYKVLSYIPMFLHALQKSLERI